MRSYFLFVAFSLISMKIGAQNDSLVAYYPFNGTPVEELGTGINGINHLASLTTDRFGHVDSAYLFNSTVTSYIDLGDNFDNIFAGVGAQFSFSFWIDPYTNMSNRTIIAKNGDSNCNENGRQFNIRISTDGKIEFMNFMHLHTTNIRQGVKGNTVIDSSYDWINVVITYDGTISSVNGLERIKIYIDGVQEATSFSTSVGNLQYMENGSSHLGIGVSLNSNGASCTPYAFDGKIDDIKLFDKVLTVSEVVDQYNDPDPLNPFVNLGADTTVCEGDIFVLDAGPGYSYLWNTTGIERTIITDTAGLYIVTISDANNTQFIDSINITIFPSPNVDLGNDTAFCFGSTILLDPGIYNSYLWNDGSTDSILHVINTGDFSVTITNQNFCTAIDTISITIPDMIDVSFTTIDNSGTGLPDGEIHSIISGGLEPYSFMWSNGESTQNLVELNSGIYFLSITDNLSCIGIDSVEVTGPTYFPPDWSFVNTGISHTILVTDTIDVTVDYAQISYGDYIGVFYDSLGFEACAGYGMWQGQNLAITVWGDDSQTSQPDGFTAGETFNWKIWEAYSNTEYIATANYMTPPVMLNTDTYVANGLSGLSSLEAFTIEFQYVPLQQGWSYFSSYMDAFEPNIDSLTSPIINDVIIVKDGDGNTFWPQWNINMIGDIQIGDAYQIKMVNTQTVTIAGYAVLPENTSITIPQGWSLLGYLRQYSAPINLVLDSIVNEIVIVKNTNGQTFWPQFGVNAIGDMNPGEGYLIKMNSQQVFNYPSNSVLFTKSNIDVVIPHFYKNVINTGSNMTLGLNTSEFEVGSEIGVFSQNNLLIGASAINSNYTYVTLWGDDNLTNDIIGLYEGEEFVIKHWNKSESIIKINSWMFGDGIFELNKISVADKIELVKPILSSLNQNYPNPTKAETVFSFYLHKSSYVEFEIINVLGESMELLRFDVMSKGEHKINYNCKDFSPGTYFYRIKIDGFEITKKMIVMAD